MSEEYGKLATFLFSRHNFAQRSGLAAVGIFANVLPGTDDKFIIKSSLFVQIFNGACLAETEDWLCF